MGEKNVGTRQLLLEGSILLRMDDENGGPRADDYRVKRRFNNKIDSTREGWTEAMRRDYRIKFN